MRKKLLLFLILIVLCLVSSACNQASMVDERTTMNNDAMSRDTGTDPYAEEAHDIATKEAATTFDAEMLSWDDFRDTLYSVLPDINSFSGEDCSGFDRYFFPVETSAINCNGSDAELPNDDARLIRLKNFILFSEKEGSAGMSFGYLNEEDLQTYYESFPSYIRLSLNNPEGKNPAGLTIDAVYGLREMVIFADRYVLIGAFDNGDLCIEEHFPFMSTLNEYVDASGYPDESALQYADPNLPWIDMLQYCGLVNTVCK